jgi:hypothetical protein
LFLTSARPFAVLEQIVLGAIEAIPGCGVARPHSLSLNCRQPR